MTLFLVVSEIDKDASLFKTLDTVVGETPAAWAMSFIVAIKYAATVNMK
ncbi:hypothetical Protein YC6258_01240 [Gynuella sunshinyii YC6258]|uniref:Uncharacterized protein n=1 Tax=Gynuella sunshinyii YC6258 TaxID=1445510 RepID=A0A0C5VFH5_9GAMM|nr:hypothetical Protein YC6258_01240 [Gynuella sunshinyii YC6258]